MYLNCFVEGPELAKKAHVNLTQAHLCGFRNKKGWMDNQLTISFLRKASCVSRFVVLRPPCGDCGKNSYEISSLLSHLS